MATLTDGSSGQILDLYKYDEFGNVDYLKQSTDNRILYASQYLDTETGNYYLKARYYNPLIGRFTQRDPHWTPANMIYGDITESAPTPEIRSADYTSYVPEPLKRNEMTLPSYGDAGKDKVKSLIAETMAFSGAVYNGSLYESYFTGFGTPTEEMLFSIIDARYADNGAILQSTNLYVYCGNNSIMFVDPSGLAEKNTGEIFTRLGVEGKVEEVKYGWKNPIRWFKGEIKEIKITINGQTQTYNAEQFSIDESGDIMIEETLILDDFYGDIGNGTESPTKQQVMNYITRVCYMQGLPVDLGLAVAWTENSFNHWNSSGNVVISGSGDYGLMQINKNAHPDAFKSKNEDIVNNWHDNANYGITFLAKCYKVASDNGMTGDDLYKGTYSKYNSGSIYNYQNPNHQTVPNVNNFWENYTTREWEK